MGAAFLDLLVLDGNILSGPTPPPGALEPAPCDALFTSRHSAALSLYTLNSCMTLNAVQFLRSGDIFHHDQHLLIP